VRRAPDGSKEQDARGVSEGCEEDGAGAHAPDATRRRRAGALVTTKTGNGPAIRPGPVLDDVTVVAGAGARIGVVGENGAGKSTLLGVLAGVLVPQSGAVRRAGSLAVVTQELEVAPGATVGTLVDSALVAVRAAVGALEASIAAFDHSSGDLPVLTEALARVERLAGWDADRRMDEALSRFGAPRDPARPLAEMSVGERYRVRLACRIAQRADVLLLDEPTNHLDESGIEYLTAQLGAWPGVVVIVTHDRQLLDDLMTAILDLDPTIDGRPALYGATDYATYRFAKDQALRRWRQRYVAEQKRKVALLARLDESYEGLSDAWRPPKGSQPNRRATHARIHVKAADRLVQQLEARAVEVPLPPLALAFPDLPALPAGSGGTPPRGPLLEVRAPLVPGRLDVNDELCRGMRPVQHVQGREDPDGLGHDADGGPPPEVLPAGRPGKGR